MRIVSISSKEEVESITEALDSYHSVNEHLKKAVEKIANRKNPDYKNSIKESISAVESLCCKISNKKDLSASLKEIENKGIVALHPALKEAFIKMYAYTSDKGGIRHANKFGLNDNVSFEDAKYMLVACSAFINYLKVKIDKAGIKL